MKPHESQVQRRAYSLNEFARVFNKSRSWSYRMARSGRIKTIAGYGNLLVPADEVDRILNGGSLLEKP